MRLKIHGHKWAQWMACKHTRAKTPRFMRLFDGIKWWRRGESNPRPKSATTLVAVDHDLHQVRGGHLFPDVLYGVLLGSDLVELRHGGHVEEHGHQALILALRSSQAAGCDRGRGSLGRGSRSRLGGDALFELLWSGLFVGHRGQQIVIQLLEFEDLNVLLLGVFSDFEVFLLEVRDGIPHLVLHADVYDDQPGLAGEGRSEEQ